VRRDERLTSRRVHNGTQTHSQAMPRFMEKVVIEPSGCWEWSAFVDPGGYARFYFNGPAMLAHRFSYEAHVGPIPPALEIDHVCRNTRCVNPAHLEAVTADENFRRVSEARTHCRNGHPYDDANTYVAPGERRRYCRICCAANSKKYKARIRAERGYSLPDRDGYSLGDPKLVALDNPRGLQ
jgi:hypothetical protein